VRRCGLIIVAFSFLTGTEGDSPEAAGDKEKIQGTWKVVSQGGIDIKVVKVVITADKLTMEFAGGKFPAVYKLDPSKKPKAFDVEGNAVDPKTKERKFAPGIYALEGDELKMCWDANCKARPTEFTKVSKEGQDLRLLVLERAKKK
jgi:uncharacterized protein (TIGR03067 family)